MNLADEDRLSCPREVLSRVLDGEAVLLHLGTGTYFGMNEVATRAWELVVAGTTFGALRDTLEKEFEVEKVELDRDLRELVQALCDKNLAIVTPSQP